MITAVAFCVPPEKEHPWKLLYSAMEEHHWKLLESAIKKLLESASEKLLHSASSNLRNGELISLPSCTTTLSHYVGHLLKLLAVRKNYLFLFHARPHNMTCKTNNCTLGQTIATLHVPGTW